MIRNMGRTDRIVRAAVIAPALLVAALLMGVTSVAGVVAMALAGVMLATAAVGWCPLYLPFGLSTDRGGPAATE